MKENKITEKYSYTHKDITVVLEIDYLANKISLIDGFGKAKKYVFAERGVEYMNSWVNILEAMQEAIKNAKEKYEANLAEVSKFKEDEIILLKLMEKENE